MGRHEKFAIGRQAAERIIGLPPEGSNGDIDKGPEAEPVGEVLSPDEILLRQQEARRMAGTLPEETTRRIEAARRLMSGIDPARVAEEAGYTIAQVTEFAERYKGIVNQRDGALPLP